MDPALILADVQIAISLGRLAVQLGQEAAPYLINAYNIAFGHKILTAEERQKMRDDETAMRAQIDAVIAGDDATDGA